MKKAPEINSSKSATYIRDVSKRMFHLDLHEIISHENSNRVREHPELENGELMYHGAQWRITVP
jgi:hypothetical protein